MNLAHPSRLIQLTLSLMFGLSLVLISPSAPAQNRNEDKDPLLSQEEIDLIKVYEVRLDSDPPPRIAIPRDELRNFLKEYQENDLIPRGKREQERWLRADGHVHLELLFKLRARDYYKHVRVKSKIESLHQFGNIHRRYILGFFQPVFGAGAVEGLYLFPRGRETERIEMTNFYILTQVSIDGKPIIDRNVPKDSLLVQWGLPRESAKFAAPEDLDRWQPQFKSEDDERFKELVNWIESLIAVNQGSDYGISYKMPQHEKPRN